MTSHTRNRIHVSTARLAISAMQDAAETIGSSGTDGVRKGRFIFGSVRRSTATAIETTTKAKSVPIETISASVLSGTKAPSRQTATVVTIVIRVGVRNFGWILPTEAGSSPSRHRA